MTGTLGFFGLVAATVSAPARAAEAVLAFRSPRDVLWLSVVAVAALWVMAQWLFFAAFDLTGALSLPLPGTLFVILASLMTILVFVFYFTGTAFGGRGTFPGAMVMVSWCFFVLLLAWPFVMVVRSVPDPWQRFVDIALVGAALRTLIHFLNRLHRFESTLKSAVVLFAAIGGLAVGFGLILAALGLTIQLEAFDVRR